MNDSKNKQEIPAEIPALLQELFTLLERHKQLFNQVRLYHRATAMVMAELFTFGRHTISQLLLSLGLTDEDWSAWYRLFSLGRFPAEEALAQVRQETYELASSEQVYVFGVDSFHLPRSSMKMPGSGWGKGEKTAKWRPGIQRMQRYVEGSWLVPMQRGYSRAIPIACQPAFTEKAVASGVAPQKEWACSLTIIQQVRAEMDQRGDQDKWLLTLADGNFDTLAWWRGLPARVAGLDRTARNRSLYALPPARPAQPGPGCPPKYGAKALAPHQWLAKRKGFRRRTILLRGRKRSVRYRLEGPFLREDLPGKPLFLIVVGGGKRPSGSRRLGYKPAFFLVSAVAQADGSYALPLPITALLTWVWQRWELEVAHREMKTELGLGQKKCWPPHGTYRAVQWSAWVYALLLLAAYKTWGLLRGPKPLGRWRRRYAQRWSFSAMWRAFRQALWGRTEFSASWLWFLDNWPKKESFLDNLFHAALSTSRA